MRPQGRRTSLALLLLLLTLLLTLHLHASALAEPSIPLLNPMLPPVLILKTSATTTALRPATTAASTATPGTSLASVSAATLHPTPTQPTSRAIATAIASAIPPPVTANPSPKAPAPATPSPKGPILPKRCKTCPPNNNLGLTCFKNTQCVPVSLLCSTTNNTTTNPCMDTTGPPSADDPITCQDQLCYAKNFLPLPAPGSGKINRNSSANCLAGSYFSQYGSTSAGGMRYTQSCVALFGTTDQPTTPTCKDWEYSAQNSCFLSTCGPGMDCEPPLICRKSNISSTPALYGLCMSSSATGDPGGDDDSDPSSAKDHLIMGLLIGICSLLLGVGIGAGLWHYRKRRIRQLALLNGEDDVRALNEKTSFLATLRTCFHSCCGCLFGGRTRARSNGSDEGAAAAGGTRDLRTVSVVESESHEGSLITDPRSDHRSNLIFARRWRWGAGRHIEGGDPGAGVTAGGQAVLPEIEPPPLYHQGPDLPSYRDRNTLLLTHVPGMPNAAASDHAEDEEHATGSTPK